MMFTMNCSKSDVVLLPIPFTDLSSAKVRPAVVVGFAPRFGDLFLVAVTSNLGNGEIRIKDWKKSGLNVPSAIKGQLTTAEARLVRKVVGRLSVADSFHLEERLREWLDLD